MKYVATVLRTQMKRYRIIWACWLAIVGDWIINKADKILGGYLILTNGLKVHIWAFSYPFTVAYIHSLTLTNPMKKWIKSLIYPHKRQHNIDHIIVTVIQLPMHNFSSFSLLSSLCFFIFFLQYQQVSRHKEFCSHLQFNGKKNKYKLTTL